MHNHLFVVLLHDVMTNRILFLLVCVVAGYHAGAQVYIETGNGTATVDLCTCTQGPLVDTTQTSTIAAGPGQNLYYLISGAIYRYNTATGVQTFLGNMPAGLESVTLVYGPNGTLYTIGSEFDSNGLQTLFSINPNTGAVTNLGDLPPEYQMQGDVFFFNGLLYALAANSIGTSIVLQVPLNNPGAAVEVFSYFDFFNNVGAITVIINGIPKVIVIGTEISSGLDGLWEINMVTGEYTLFCPGVVGGDLAAPPGYVVPPCCENVAGSLLENGLQTYCVGETAVVTHNNNEELASGSALSFILVSDTNALFPAGVIQTAASPNFPFTAPAMSVNTVYYVAPVAAPGAAGAPQWNAGCVDVGFFVPVVWRPRPAVSFSVGNPNVCAGVCTNQCQFYGYAAL
jgi:hypothetical protein